MLPIIASPEILRPSRLRQVTDQESMNEQLFPHSQNSSDDWDEIAVLNGRSLSTLARAITLSQNSFALILVRCNYQILQQQLWEHLQEIVNPPCQSLMLSESTPTLLSFLKETTKAQGISGLVIFGWEKVKKIDELLMTTNQVRDQLRQHFHFPLVLCITDEGLHKLARFAPDFKSWAAASIKLELPAQALLELWEKTTAELLNRLLATGGKSFLPNEAVNLAPDALTRQELEFARSDLYKRGLTLTPEKKAIWQLILGRDSFSEHNIQQALFYYEQSLNLCRSGSNTIQEDIWQGIILFHLGLGYYSHHLKEWESARYCFEASREIFQSLEFPEWVAQLTLQLGKVFQKQQNWGKLQALAENALMEEAMTCNQARVAELYGFLAQVALAQQHWKKAIALAKKALSSQAMVKASAVQSSASLALILATAQRQLGQFQEAIATLEKAKLGVEVAESPRQYLEILEQLRSLYFQQKDYRQAFEIKQEQRRIEQKSGLQAFLGVTSLPIASQITSSRQRDIKALLERISRSDSKLTVIHGASGVGKTSLLQSGFIPNLSKEIIGAREVLPIVLNNYSNWEEDLGNAFQEVLQKIQPKNQTLSQINRIELLLEQLQEQGKSNFLTVLIFDQLEEFFFLCRQTNEREEFYTFLKTCLNLPFVKIILSIREDYLHYLLEIGKIDVIDNNILARQIRYPLRDLSIAETISFVQELTQQFPFPMEESLIEAFVQDLARETGTVRPIELQVVGAQLQAEKIITLTQYQHLGEDPKTILVERSLSNLIADCGIENEDAVWQVLFTLTDERGTRPLKSKAELAIANTGGLGEKKPLDFTTLDLVLTILVGSGVVCSVREAPEACYQLVHDYLVKPIRAQYHARMKSAIEAQFERNEKELTVVRKQRLQAIAISSKMAILATLAGAFAWQANLQRQMANETSVNAQLQALTASSQALLAADQQFNALLEGLRAGKRLEAIDRARFSPPIHADTRLQVATVLEQALYRNQEQNRLEGHLDAVWEAVFSPDGQLIASASRDNTLKLWSPNGKEITTLTGHTESVTSVSFSPNGEYLASSSWDGTVRLWTISGREVRKIEIGAGYLYKVSFHPNGEKLAVATATGTVQIWSVEGKLLQTLSGHSGIVNWLSWSPNGKQLVSVGEDKTIRIWTETGTLQKEILAHDQQINQVAFSPQGDIFATSSEDKTVKLWSREGELLKTLTDHEDYVIAIAFSRNGQYIATAGEDNLIKLWSRDGKLLKTLTGHTDAIVSLHFSGNGQTLLSTSYDKTIKLWDLKTPSRLVLFGHTDHVRDVVFSPDGDRIATGSDDTTVKLWNRQGKLIQTLQGHTDKVYSVSFSSDSQLLASASHDGTIKLWHSNGSLFKTLTGHTDWVLDVTWSPNGQYLASASRDSTIKVWTRNGELVQTLWGHSDRVNSVAFSPDGKMLASTSDDKTVKLWYADKTGKFSNQQTKTLKGHSNWVLDAQFSPNGQLLASAGYDNRVKLWDLQGNLQQTLKGHTDSVAHIRFSPTGEILATTTWDSQLQLWRLDDTLLTSLSGHLDRITNVNWSYDGKAIATASHDQTVVIWNLNLTDLLDRSCQVLGDYLEYNPKVRKSDRNLCL